MNHVLAGIDLGGTTIRAALADQDGTLLIEDAIPTDSHCGPDDVVTRMGALVLELSERLDVTVQSVGIGVPGLVDVKTGTTKFLPNLPTQWQDVPVASLMRDRLDCPVHLLNDVRTATLGELRFGHGKHHPDVSLAFFSLGTGVGGGVAIDGQLRLGPLGAAGELGHQTVVPYGARCGCGNRGCLETVASGPAIAAEGIRLMRSGLAPKLRDLVDGVADRVTPREMAAAAEEDELVKETLVQAARYIGIAAANVVTILHPDLVVLGGGVAAIGDLLTGTVMEEIQRRVCMFPTNELQVKRSLLGDKAGLIGSVAIAMEAMK